MQEEFSRQEITGRIVRGIVIALVVARVIERWLRMKTEHQFPPD